MTTIIFTFDDEVECPECGGEGRVEYEFEVIDHIRGGDSRAGARVPDV